MIVTPQVLTCCYYHRHPFGFTRFKKTARDEQGFGVTSLGDHVMHVINTNTSQVQSILLSTFHAQWHLKELPHTNTVRSNQLNLTSQNVKLLLNDTFCPLELDKNSPAVTQFYSVEYVAASSSYLGRGSIID